MTNLPILSRFGFDFVQIFDSCIAMCDCTDIRRLDYGMESVPKISRRIVFDDMQPKHIAICKTELSQPQHST
jgi:hypothetical protein